LAEWLYEAGIGECRAALIEDGIIIEAQVELPGLRAGTVAEARLTSILVAGRRGIATLVDGSEVLIEPLPKITEGAAIRVEITREAIPEPDALKRAKGRITDAELCDGPNLATRIGPHHALRLHDADLLEAAGWSECLEDAARGIIAYRGGTLRISLTPAMTLIDIDGDDAIAGAHAAGLAIRRFGLAGSIGIDLPTVAGKTERQAIAAAFDAALPQPYERTALNGFGFLQVIRPRIRSSLCETMQQDSIGASARALIRSVQRSGTIGSTEIRAPAPVILAIECNPGWTETLSRQLGGLVSMHVLP
jgi:hypothetical protein